MNINESIKILQKRVEIDRKLRQNSTESDYDKFCENECIAIENLIKGYRELEKHITFYEKNGSYKERIIELKEEIKYLKHEVDLSRSAVERLVKEKLDSIPKSKIKEQILNPMKEEHDKAITGFMKRDIPQCIEDGGIAQVLGCFIGKIEELMEDK